MKKVYYIITDRKSVFHTSMLRTVTKENIKLKTHDLVLDAIIFSKLGCVELENQELKNSAICPNCLNYNWPIQDMLWLGLGPTEGDKTEK